MAFLDSLTSRAPSPTEAALACAVTVLTLDGDLLDIERRIIALFRDQFPPLSSVDEAVFIQTLNRAIEAVTEKNVAADIPGFVRTVIAPAITAPADRLAAYRYVYSLAMADLNLDDGETALLSAMQSVLGLAPADCRRAEQEALAEFHVLHEALAATVLGLMVVSADGQVQDDELAHVREARNLLAPIGRLDDVQFDLVFDLSLYIHDRFLLDPNNRRAFVEGVVTPMLDQEHRPGAFEYIAAIATADGDIAQAEVEVLKEVLTALGLQDAQGEAIFNRYMGRIRTIDGKPR
jgi:uncharacterized tellurite resistance protein B-like protein